MTREEWLSERRTGIGGSDAAPAVGLSKWKTPLELWLDKRGELETPENEPMKWGTLLEPVVRQEYANRTGRTVVVPGRILRHATVSFAIVNADGIADESRLYEGKTARTAEGWGEPGTNEIPLECTLQCQHGMFVTGLAVTDVAVLIGGSDFRLYEVPADPELQSMLMEQEAAFWQMVQTDTPPAPLSREDVKRRWRVSSGRSITASVDVARAAATLAAVKNIIKAAEHREGELSALIQQHMGDAAELCDGGSVLATWKNVNASPRFDMERFREEQPDLWKSYLKEPQPSRRFLLKGSKAVERMRFTEVAERLTAMGGVLNTQSDSGSMYFDLPGGLHVRVSDHEPNEATAAWMTRRYVRSVRVDMEDWRDQLEAITNPKRNLLCQAEPLLPHQTEAAILPSS